MDITASIALSMGAAWASGLNLYATCAMLGIMGATGSIDLPTGLETLENPWVIAAAGAMYVVEFFADKIPGVDSAWDTIHSFIRVPAGAVLAATVFADASTAEMLAAGAGGGVLTAATYRIKAGSRLLINTSPEPFSNWTASVSEDVAVFCEAMARTLSSRRVYRRTGGVHPAGDMAAAETVARDPYSFFQKSPGSSSRRPRHLRSKVQLPLGRKSIGS